MPLKEISTSLISGLLLVLFAAFVIGTCELNNEALNRFFMNFELIIPLIGIPYIAATSIVVSQRLLSRKEEPRAVPHSTLLVIAILSCPLLIVVFLFCPALIICGAPLLVWSAQAVACAVLIRSGVPKDCMLLLIASVVLAAAVSPVAIAIGSEKDQMLGACCLAHRYCLGWFVLLLQHFEFKTGGQLPAKAI